MEAARTFVMGHAVDADWETMVELCFNQMQPIPERGNIGFIYVTDLLDEDLPLVVEWLREKTGIQHWVGTVGFGVMVSGQEYFDVPAIVSMIGSFPDHSFCVMPSVNRPGDPLPDHVMKWVTNTNPFFGVVHADPRNAYVRDILNAITDDTDTFLIGGLTASRGRQPQIADSLTEGGVSGVLFSKKVSVSTGLSQGCSPIGAVHEVTGARDNILIELDGRPALDVFREDVGEVLSRNLERVAGYIHAALPIAGDDSGDYLVRNVVGIDPSKKLVVIGERISVGDRVMFVRRDKSAAMDDLERMVADVTNRASGEPKAALYYSCVARGPNLFGANSEEMKTIQAALGNDVPLVGFYANGEISNNRLYGYTGVLTLFS